MPWAFILAGVIVISRWLFPKFYFSADAGSLSLLKRIASFIELAVLASFFFTWVPAYLGGETGWALIKGGRWGVTAVFALVIVSLALIAFSNRPVLLKTGAAAHITASILILVALVRLFPETIRMSFGESAPIFAVLLLLAGNVIVLFMWHQLQILAGEKIKTWVSEEVLSSLKPREKKEKKDKP